MRELDPMSFALNINRRQVTIVIAEDSATQAQELCMLLEEQGFRVLRGRNGAEALSMVVSERPDLIISDVMMPEMDGYQFCRAIKADLDLAHTPFILVTTLSTPHDVFRGLDVGADNFIIKPYDQELLLSRIRYILTNRDLRKSGKLQVGIEIELSGQRHFITAERQQILDLLISTYEQAVRLNEALELRQKELARSYDTINALYGIADSLNRCRTEAEVVSSAVESGLALPGVKAGWMFLKDYEGYRLAACKGISGEALGANDCGDCQCQRFVNSGRMNETAEVVECERLARTSDAAGLRYHATVALVSDDKPIGILNLVGTEEKMFSEEALRTLSGVGNQIVVALERARLHEALERKVQERTAKLHAEMEKRKETNETLSTILDSTPVPTVTENTDGIVLSWNRAAEAVFGYASAEVIGQDNPLRDAQSPDQDLESSALASGDVVRDLETRRRHKNGNLIDVRMSCSPLYGRAHEIRGQVKVLEDLRERKRIEEQLHQAQKMEAIGNLTGGIAHDFNNLLTIVIGNVELASRSLKENPENAELLEGALSACLRGADLTRQLLAFGRRQTLKPEMVDVNRLIRGMVKLLVRTLGAQVRIEFVEGQGIWPVIIDPAQLDSAIVNLAVNARDAMPDGGMLTVETANVDVDDNFSVTHPGLKPGGYVVISVTDTGTGMPPDVLSRIFEPFYTTKAINKGTGLGLSMVYGFVKQSGGHVTVYSEVGAGTTFRLYLPRAMAQVDGPAKSAPSLERRRSRGTERILVVEDNDAVRRMVCRQLSDMGYQVAVASHAKEAIEIISQGNQFDAVFSDVVMPGEMSGVKLAAEIANRWPKIKVLLTSGFPEAALNQANGDLRARILSKPYRADDLERAILELLES
jgi:PAS domain S-box-containing protein